MTGTRTIVEIAAELRLSPRRLRALVVENGLYLMAPGSNRKRMTQEHVAALKIMLKGAPCQSGLTSGKPASTISAGNTSANVLTKALELAARSKQEYLRRNARGTFSSATSKGQKPSRASPKPQLIISRAAGRADT